MGFGVCVWYTHFELIGAIVVTVFFWVVRHDEEGAQTRVGEVRDGKYPLVSKLVSEFIEMYMLVLTVGLNVLGVSTAGAFSLQLL